MKNTRKKIYFIIIFILLLIGGTYAFFNFTLYTNDRYELVDNVYIDFATGSSFNVNDGFPESDESARNATITNRTINGVTIPVAENEMAFYISGSNDNASKKLKFSFLLNDGSPITNKARLKSKFLKFDLVEYIDGINDVVLVSGMSFPSFIDTTIYTGEVDLTGTHYYKLRMWIDENVLISDTDSNADYAATAGGSKTAFSSTYASIKVTCVGELV